MIEISVIITTYNANWDSLKETIDSVVSQKNIQYEIIFADDGSKIKWNKQITEYLLDTYEYSFVDLFENQGTVTNILNALKTAKGEIIKVISPGDCLAEPLALRKWADYMKNQNADMCFCNAIYYCKGNESGRKVVEKPNSPKNIKIYHKTNSRKELFIDYLLANDFILGASIMIKREVFLSYLQEMSGYVKYAEDYMVRLMVFDNKRIAHIDENLIFYEYGEGISTSGNNKWSEILHNDFEATDQIIGNRKLLDENIKKRYQIYLKSNKRIRRLIKVILFPTMIINRIKMKYFYRKTPTFLG